MLILSDNLELVFYSGFMVADKITLITKSPKAEIGVKWTSTGDGSYEIEELDRKNRGTDIILSLKEGEDFETFLEPWKIKELIKNIQIMLDTLYILRVKL